MASGHLLDARSACSAQACSRKEPQAQGRLWLYRQLRARGLPFHAGVPPQMASRLCAPQSHSLHRTTFTFCFFLCSKNHEARSYCASSLRWGRGWRGQKDWPLGPPGHGEKGGMAAFCVPLAVSESHLMTLPWSLQRRHFPKRGCGCYLTGPSSWGRLEKTGMEKQKQETSSSSDGTSAAEPEHECSVNLLPGFLSVPRGPPCSGETCSIPIHHPPERN